MKIAVVNGTEINGCTYHIKEAFLDVLRDDNEITEFYLPRDCPHFCVGCKVCFFKDDALCPHAEQVMPIWNAILEADLIVFAYPVYVLRSPGQIKALLDHFAVHWMVHRPDVRMWDKRAVILTNSVGAPNGTAQKDVATSLSWLGVSSVKKLGFGLMDGVIWNELSAKRRERILKKTAVFAAKFKSITPARKSLKHRLLFAMCKVMHQSALKKETEPSADNRYWVEQGWIKPKER